MLLAAASVRTAGRRALGAVLKQLAVTRDIVKLSFT